jgi:hypothetical protein
MPTKMEKLENGNADQEKQRNSQHKRRKRRTALETPKAMEIFMVITIIKNRLTTILVVIY